MHAIVCTASGDPTVMQWTQLPDPQAGPGDVLIKVEATAVNRADILQREGRYPPPPGASHILGLECAGVVVDVGPGVTMHTVGAQVTALLAGGGYAEMVCVPAQQVMSLPTPIPLAQAAALPEAACTVWSNLAMVAKAQPGEFLLVHGGASGIGTAAIQIARAMGLRVAVTAGSQDKLDTCAELGAEVLINYKTTDFVEAIARETGGSGADVILDIMGAAYLERNIAALARNGRLVIIGLQGGTSAEVNVARLLAKNASVHPTSLRGRPLHEKAAICAQVQARVWPWVQAGVIRPVIGETLGLPDAAHAHRLLESGAVTGKILLTVPPTR